MFPWFTKNPQNNIWGTIINGVKIETTCLFGIPVPRMKPNPEKALYSKIRMIQKMIGLYENVMLNPIDQYIIAVNIVGKIIPAGISVKTLPQK